MRTPLDDITNTATTSSSITQFNDTNSKQYTPKSSYSSLRPKLLRQTSLLAFTAARSVPSSSSSSSYSSSTCSSPAASTSHSSSPPPLPPSSSSSSCILHPHSDEGYSSTTIRDSNILDCDNTVRDVELHAEDDVNEEEEEEDDAFSDTEYSYNKRQKRHSTTTSTQQRHHHEPQVIIRDPASMSRQAKAMARNKANYFGDTSRASRFEDVARISEYSRGNVRAPSNALGRVSGGLTLFLFLTSLYHLTTLTDLSVLVECTDLTDRHPNNYLESFISHHTRDVIRCPSYRGHRNHAPPFACAFSKGWLVLIASHLM